MPSVDQSITVSLNGLATFIHSSQRFNGADPMLINSTTETSSIPRIIVNTTRDEVNGDTSSIARLLANPGGQGISLREAIIATNNTAGSANIILKGGQTYQLTRTNSGADTASFGDLDILGNGKITISSNSSQIATIDGNEIDRVLTVSAQTTASLNRIRITGGKTNSGGGGIANFGVLDIRKSIVSKNTSGNGGGGIFNTPTGTLTLIDSSVNNNAASLDGGGIFNSSKINLTSADTLGEIKLIRSTVSNNISGEDGGGIAAFIGTMTLNNSRVLNNQATGNGGGIAAQGGSSFLDSERTFNVTNSRISANRAGKTGGGIFLESKVNDDKVTVTRSTISNNRAVQSGGGIQTQDNDVLLISSNISGNTSPGNGGGIAHAGLTATTSMVNTRISGNQAGVNGGGIFNNGRYGRVLAVDATISSNRATQNGGGLFNTGSLASFVNSTFNHNRAGRDGGGIETDVGASTELRNSTISGNRANDDGGGIYNSPTIGAIDPLGGVIAAVIGGKTTLVNSTVTQNIADADGNGQGEGGGVANRRFSQGIQRFLPGQFSSQNSIIAGNFDTVSNNGPGTIHRDISGAITGNKSNLIGNRAGAEGTIGSGSDIVANPQLSPLQDNGGATLTHALLPNSPAINAGNNRLAPLDVFDRNNDGNRADFFPFDQRGQGFRRINDGTIDIGAFESRPPIIGSNQNDVLLGDAGDNLISGLGRNDTLRGVDGNDTLNGGTGHDWLYGGNGNDRLLGGDGQDLLAGGNGQDRLIGGAANDRLIGGNDADLLTGNSGADEFRWVALSQSRLNSFDRITDLMIGTDILNGPTAIAARNIDQLGAVQRLNQQGIQAVLRRQVFEANTAATFRLGSRTFLALNDGVAGFDASKDALIEITGFSGRLSNLSIQ